MIHALVRMAILTLVLCSSLGAVQRHSVTRYTGTFPDGATYLIEVPANWNGTLLLFSHGYVAAGQPNPAVDRSDPLSGKYLLAQGYALAGSSYASAGWAVQAALTDQINVLAVFATRVGQPTRIIAWGQSMGGLITAGLIQQNPASFTAALPMCGAVGGAVGTWNSFLDSAFAFNTLLAQGQLQVVNISDPAQNVATGLAILNSAQNSLPGRARIALVAALADIPGWFYAGSRQPGPTGYLNQEKGQYLWLLEEDLYFGLELRAELEARAGGNPSWNAGIDYRVQFAASADQAEVNALYAEAGLDLQTDLAALNAAAQITANSAALTYLSDNIILDGVISVPVLSMQTQGDGLVVSEADSAYAAAVNAAGDGALLRQTFVARAGHCTFTSAETIAALDALVSRLNSGTWSGLEPGTLNAVAAALGPTYNRNPPAFSAFAPGPFLRTYNGMPPTRRPTFPRTRIQWHVAP
jgi:pimeloyl-ACP methyl ester carboxylesterase